MNLKLRLLRELLCGNEALAVGAKRLGRVPDGRKLLLSLCLPFSRPYWIPSTEAPLTLLKFVSVASNAFGFQPTSNDLIVVGDGWCQVYAGAILP